MATLPDPQITLALPLSQVNLLLAKLAKATIEDCIDLFMEVRMQTQQQVARLQETPPAESPVLEKTPAKPNGAMDAHA